MEIPAKMLLSVQSLQIFSRALEIVSIAISFKAQGDRRKYIGLIEKLTKQQVPYDKAI